MLIIFFSSILFLLILMLISFFISKQDYKKMILLIGNEDNTKYYQYKMSSLYNIKTLVNLDDLYKIDINLFDCIVNLDCDKPKYIYYIIRNKVPLLNLVKLEKNDFIKLAKEYKCLYIS